MDSDLIGTFFILALIIFSFVKKMWDDHQERQYEETRQQRTQGREQGQPKPARFSPPPSSPPPSGPTPLRSLQLEQARQRREASELARRQRQQAVQQIARALPDRTTAEKPKAVPAADRKAEQVRRERVRMRRLVVHMIRDPRSFRAAFLFSEIIGPPRSMH